MRTLAAILTSLVALAAIDSAGAQTVTLTSFPADLQLIPRQHLAEVTPLTITGRAAAADFPLGRLTAKLSTADGELVDDLSADLVEPPAGDSGSFSLTLALPVTRVDHSVALTLERPDGTTAVLAQAERVVSGDVYVVNGQSNAEAHVRIHPDDRDPFLRGYNGPGEDPGNLGWTELRYARGGYWAGRAANRLSAELDVPIAVFNFGRGGQPLDFFEVGSPGGNYAQLTGELAAAGVTGDVAAFFWFQGEADGFDTSVRSYRSRLEGLFASYRAALGIDDIVLFQVRPYTCFATSPNIAEAQRRMAAADPNLLPLATTNVRQRDDACHFEYETGYAVIGERAADLLREHVYGRALTGTTSPDIDSARVTGPREITAYLNVPGSSLAVTGAPWPDFVAEGIDAAATGGSIVGNRLVLTFARDVVGATGLSYRGRSDTTLNYLHNARGVGALLWYDVSLVPGDGAAGRLADLRLGLARGGDAGALGAGESTEVVLSAFNHGGTTLTDVVVAVDLPDDLDYPRVEGGVYRGRTRTAGRFDGSLGQWVIPSLRPGAEATLTLEVVAGATGASDAVVWAQSVDQDQPDADSEAADGATGLVRADDEVRLVIGRPSEDCALDVALVGSSCDRTGDVDRWALDFAPARGAAGELNHRLDLTAALLSEGAGGRVVIDATGAYEAGTEAFVVELSRPAGDLACTNSFPLTLPAGCGRPAAPPDTGGGFPAVDTSRCCGLIVTCATAETCDTVELRADVADSLRAAWLAADPGACDATDCQSVDVDEGDALRGAGLTLVPNPVGAGRSLHVTVPQALPAGARALLFDATGRAIELDGFVPGSRRLEVLLPPDLAPGPYVLRLGGTAARLLVE